MMRRSLTCLAALAIAAPCWAESGPAQAERQLAPRAPLIKFGRLDKPELTALDRARGFQERLVVKYRDTVKARPTPGGGVMSLTQTNLTEINDRAAAAGVTFKRVFRRSDERLAVLERRAEDYSNRRQPDLGSIHYIEGEPAALHEFGNWLLRHNLVEWLTYEQPLRPAHELENGQPPLAASTNAPGAGGPGGVSQEPPDDPGDGGGGIAGFQPNCGVDQGPCFTAHTGPGCGNLVCCNTVCTIDPMCCQDGMDWDQGCANLAALNCGSDRACCLYNEPFDVWVCADHEPFSCVVMGGFPQPGQYCYDNGNGPTDHPCTPQRACCLPDASCEVMPEIVCLGQEGLWLMNDTNCNNVDCASDCGNGMQNSCFVPGPSPALDPDGAPFCSHLECCESICDFFAFCCDFWWDESCVGLAHLYCDIGIENPGPMSPGGADRCLSIFNGDCFEAHPTAGCLSSSPCDDPPNADPAMDCCCRRVGEIDPFCVEVEWDTLCVSLAIQLCDATDPDGPTPAFTREQGYLRLGPYSADPPEPFDDLNTNGMWDMGEPFEDLNLNTVWDDTEQNLSVSPPAPGTGGYGGNGFELFYSGWLQDDPTDMNQQRRYAGMYGLGRKFEEVFGIDNFGQGSLTRGRSIRVAVIEWAFWAPEPFDDLNGNGQRDAGEPFIDQNLDGQYSPGHQDLDVIVEPGQTLIVDTSITEPDHATACLGIIGAREDADPATNTQEVGIVGIAPDCELHFFPLTSVEDGPRAAEAFLSAYEALGPGDITSNSWGPSVSLTLSPFYGTLLQLGTDLGITNCVAAANSCLNLDDVDTVDPFDLGFGAVLVGACTPGAPFCRLSFSNHYDSSSNIVHVAAWGANITSCGYGSLFRPDGDQHRSYTNTFGGTSGATPMIAGVAACAQGFAKQFYGIPVPPLVLRGALQSGFAQCGVVNPDDLPGWDDSLGCGPDIDPDESPNKIGPFPVLTGDFGSVTSVILNQGFAGFDDSPNVLNAFTLTGVRTFGNVYSIKASDNAYYMNSSHPRSQGDRPENVPPAYPQAGYATYTGAGQINDVLVVARNPLPNNNQMDITAELSVVGQDALIFVEVFNFQSSRWDFITVGFVPSAEIGDPDGDPDFLVPGVVFSAQAHTDQTTRNVLIRVWSLGLGGGGDVLDGPGIPGNSEYFLRLDHISLDLHVPFGSTPGGIF